MSESTQALADTFAASRSSENDYKLRWALSKAITLVESKHPHHQAQANALLQHLRGSHTHSDYFRLGIAGPPGAGKSTLIEALGMHLLEKDQVNKLAVICIDPSSTQTGGSILGDKTRMAGLATHDRAYVRPASNGGITGGLAAYTHDVVSLCRQFAELCIVETVGLGQSEIEIRQCVDMMVLVLPPTGGDELQGVKKGIMEVADLICVNKADGDLLPAARQTANDYKAATQLLWSSHSDWPRPPVVLVSAQTQSGLEDLWKQIQDYREIMTNNGALEEKRREQADYWMWKHLQTLIMARTKENFNETATPEALQTELKSLTPRLAAERLLESLMEDEESSSLPENEPSSSS